MSTIPTELLRTFVTVVEQRSFTRAAQALGVTQPSVSNHIKKLQAILGCELFDRSSPGMSLTPKGELIVTYARRLLSILNVIMQIAERGPSAQTIRIGMPADFLGGNLANLLTEFSRRWPDLRFSVEHGGLEPHLHALRQGQLDIAVGLSAVAPADARHNWPEQMVWLRGRSTELGKRSAAPLVAFREDCVYYRTAVHALHRANRKSELMLMAPAVVCLAAAVNEGLGIMALPRSRAGAADLMIWENAPLPKLPQLFWGVYLREGGDRGPLESLADSIATELRARTVAAAKRSRRAA
jgi:DNA-binding transcriptional LysR family regulator